MEKIVHNSLALKICNIASEKEDSKVGASNTNFSKKLIFQLFDNHCISIFAIFY